MKFIRRRAKLLVAWRTAAKTAVDPETGRAHKGGVELLKAVDTRFVSSATSAARLASTRHIGVKVVNDDKYDAWIRTQKPDVREFARDVRDLINSTELKGKLDVLNRVYDPIIKALRVSDNKAGATLADVYAAMTDLNDHIANPIEGLDERIRLKMHTIWYARWKYLDQPVYVAAMTFDRKYMRANIGNEEFAADRDIFFGDMSKHPELPGRKQHSDEVMEFRIGMEFVSLKEAVLQEAGMFTTELGFSEHAISSMGPILWCDQMLRKWPLMQWIGKHLMAMKTGSSCCETGWSFQKLVHSASRNRQSAKVTFDFMQAHVHLLILKRQEQKDKDLSTWQQEMIEDAIADALAAELADETGVEDDVDMSDSDDDDDQVARSRGVGADGHTFCAWAQEATYGV